MSKTCDTCGALNPVQARFCCRCGGAWSEALIRSATRVTPVMRRWRQLSQKLTRRDVRELLGEPLRVEPGDIADASAVETWTYRYEVVGDSERRAAGVLMFASTDGRLLTWNEPDWESVRP